MKVFTINGKLVLLPIVEGGENPVNLLCLAIQETQKFAYENKKGFAQSRKLIV